LCFLSLGSSLCDKYTDNRKLFVENLWGQFDWLYRMWSLRARDIFQKIGRLSACKYCLDQGSYKDSLSVCLIWACTGQLYIMPGIEDRRTTVRLHGHEWAHVDDQISTSKSCSLFNLPNFLCFCFLELANDMFYFMGRKKLSLLTEIIS
jgi:hypothetical protein